MLEPDPCRARVRFQQRDFCREISAGRFQQRFLQGFLVEVHM